MNSQDPTTVTQKPSESDALSFFCPSCHSIGFDNGRNHCPSDKCTTQRPESGWPFLPFLFDKRWVLRRQIGRGGMGVVYLAEPVHRDPRAPRRVALKLLLDGGSVERYREEMRISHFLSGRGPGFVHVREISDCGDQPYMVMDFIDAPTLFDLMYRSDDGVPFTARRALSIARQIAEALSLAHDHGIVHRDLKPPNIFVSEQNDRIWIADWGIAKIQGQSGPDLTQENMVMGSPRYFAPEQPLAQGLADHRTDLYTVGLLIYEMLTGRMPYARVEEPGEWIVHHQQSVPRPMPSVLAAVQKLVFTCLEKSPERRYPNARALVEAIKAAEASIRDDHKQLLKEVRKERGDAVEAVKSAYIGLAKEAVLVRQLDRLLSEVNAEDVRSDEILANPKQVAEQISDLKHRAEALRSMARDAKGRHESDDDVVATALQLPRTGMLVAVVLCFVVTLGVTVWMLTSSSHSSAAEPLSQEATHEENPKTYQKTSALAFLGDASHDDEEPTGTATPGDHETNCAQEIHRGLSDGQFQYRTVLWEHFNGNTVFLNPIADDAPTAGAPWFEVTVESGRVQTVVSRDAYDGQILVWTFAYDDLGRLLSREGHDRFGFREQAVLYKNLSAGTIDLQRQGHEQRWNEEECPWTRVVYGETGYPVERICLDLNGEETAQWGRASRQRVESWDACGRAEELLFTDASGVVAANTDGCERIRLETNSHNVALREQCDGGSITVREADVLGNVVSERLFDAESNELIGPEGWHERRLHYAENGGLMAECWLGSGRRPTRHSETGVSCTRYTRSADGHVLAESFFDVDETPLLNNDGIHRIEYHRDAEGYAAETRFLDTHREFTISARERFAVRQCQRDAHGRDAECSFFDQRHEPTELVDYHRETWERDDDGFVIRHCFFDTEGRPVATRAGDGAHCVVDEHNALGQLTVRRFLDRRGRPTRNTKDRVHQLHYVWDENSFLLQKTEHDADGDPTRRLGADCGVRYERDGLGQRLTMTFLDCAHQPTRNRWAGTHNRYSYDDQGNAVSRCFFDGENQLFRLRQYLGRGAACNHAEWDDNGRMTALWFTGTDNEPVRADIGNDRRAARVHFEYDEYGRLAQTQVFRRPGDTEPRWTLDCHLPERCLAPEIGVHFHVPL